MNQYIKSQINYITSMIKTFQQGCEMSTRYDDGITSKEESRTLKKINRAAERFIKDLEKLKS